MNATPEAICGQLPAPIVELLSAVRDALELPTADTTADHHARAILLDARASDAQIILAAVIRGDLITDCTNQLRGWTAERPVTYRVWVPEQAEGEGQR
ncbi:hypothetical protein ACFXJ5_16980 [Streptomyces sp. NPDC059373]